MRHLHILAASALFVSQSICLERDAESAMATMLLGKPSATRSQMTGIISSEAQSCIVRTAVQVITVGFPVESPHDRKKKSTQASPLLKKWLPLAEQGDAQAQLKVGDLYDSDKNYSDAMKWYRRAAEQGNAEAQWMVGVYYDLGGDYNPRDGGSAFPWFQKAAAQGYSKGQYALGFLYHDGRGVTQDYGKALELYRKAAAQGYPVAENGLGMMYHFGRGVPQDLVEARKWYKKAADHGFKQAVQLLALVNKDLALPAHRRLAPNIRIMMGTSEEAKKAEHAFAHRDYRMAYRFWDHVGGEDRGIALHNQGLLFTYGLGGVKDPNLAQMKFQEACHEGRRDSCAWKDKLIAKAEEDCYGDPVCREAMTAAFDALASTGGSERTDASEVDRWYKNAVTGEVYRPASGLPMHIGDRELQK